MRRNKISEFPLSHIQWLKKYWQQAQAGRDRKTVKSCSFLLPPKKSLGPDSYYNQTWIKIMRSDWDVIKGVHQLVRRGRGSTAKSIAVAEILKLFIFPVLRRFILYIGFISLIKLSSLHDFFQHCTEQLINSHVLNFSFFFLFNPTTAVNQ